jgi:DNA-binding PadR family transcriptional regulator
MRFRFGFHRFHNEDGQDDGGRRHRGFRGPFHRHGGGGPGMRGRTRMFEQGDLRLVILKLLAGKPAHGYEIIKLVEERFGGSYAPSPGIVYPTLTLLEELGQIAVVQTDGARKLYDITPEGRAVLEAERTAVDRIFERIDEVRRRHGGSSDPRIVRATENLKTALRLRIERGPLTPEQATAIATILDDAAKTIEQS